jgi:hypothetical protein
MIMVIMEETVVDMEVVDMTEAVEVDAVEGVEAVVAAEIMVGLFNVGVMTWSILHLCGCNVL